MITVGDPFGDGVEVGHVVSILTGSQAGTWRVIAQRITPKTYWLDSPLPDDATVISIASGFIRMQVTGNWIDCRGGTQASPLVLPGNQFGPVIRKNHFLGGSESIRLAAAASEKPMMWGWSHAPCLGGVVEDNVIEDSHFGAILGAEHSQYTKANAGRTYMTASLKNNRVRWSAPFLRELARARKAPKAPLFGFTFGFERSRDADECRVRTEGDQLDAPPSALGNAGVKVHAARVNGQRIVDHAFRLPPAAPSAAPRPDHGNPPKP